MAQDNTRYLAWSFEELETARATYERFFEHLRTGTYDNEISAYLLQGRADPHVVVILCDDIEAYIAAKRFKVSDGQPVILSPGVINHFKERRRQNRPRQRGTTVRIQTPPPPDFGDAA